MKREERRQSFATVGPAGTNAVAGDDGEGARVELKYPHDSDERATKKAEIDAAVKAYAEERS